MEQIDLMLFLVFAGNAEAAQRAEPGVDAVNGARLRGEFFDEFAAAADERTRFAGKFAAGAECGDLPDFVNGKVVAVQRYHTYILQASAITQPRWARQAQSNKKLIHRARRSEEKLTDPSENGNQVFRKEIAAAFYGLRSRELFLAAAAAPMDPALLTTEGETNVMQQVMARKDKIIWLSARDFQRNKPVLLLLHGATDDPTEMLEIYKEWRGKYNVCLYSYNFHRSIKKVAADLAGEMKILKAETRNNSDENIDRSCFSIRRLFLEWPSSSG